MRTAAVYLTLLLLLVVSVGAGYIASDWPHWCRRAHWCRPDWPRSGERADPSRGSATP